MAGLKKVSIRSFPSTRKFFTLSITEAGHFTRHERNVTFRRNLEGFCEDRIVKRRNELPVQWLSVINISIHLNKLFQCGFFLYIKLRLKSDADSSLGSGLWSV